jgi:hypothetical protein
VPVTGEAQGRTPGWRGLYSPRHELRVAHAELARWWRGLRASVQVDPRRWTVHGWVDAAYLFVALPLVAFGPRGDDGSSPAFVLGIVVLLVARAAFEWRWRRPVRHRRLG